MSLSEYQHEVDELYEGKHWSRDYYFIMSRAFVELGEFQQAIMRMEAGDLNPDTGKPYTQMDCAEEISDALHFILAAATVKIPHADLDISLKNKIASNWRNKKKSLDPTTGRIVKS